MARSTAAAPKRAPAPTRAAFNRLSAVLQRGASPERMMREAEAVVDDLRAAGDEEEQRVWLEELFEGFQESTEAAIEAIDEVEPTEKAARRHAENAANSMAAIRDTFGRHLGRA